MSIIALVLCGCGSSVTGGTQTAIDPVSDGSGGNDPTDPVDPVDPGGGGDDDDDGDGDTDGGTGMPGPVVAVNPINPGAVVSPTGPTGPVGAIRPVGPGNPSNPADPIDPVDPADGPRVFVVDQDHVDASDDNDGISRPFLTLQKGLSVLEPGDTLLVQGTAEPYHTDAPIDGTNLAGYVLRTSGTAEAPITIVGGQPRPVIDQGRTAASPEPAIGLLLDCTSHVIVRNVEIRHVNDAGVTTSLTGCATAGLRIESTHIHHVFGTDLVAGIRLANSSGARVRANLLHDITREAGAPTPVVATAGATQDVLVQSNTVRNTESGVTLRSAGHDIANVAIERNRLTELGVGVHARADAHSTGKVSDISIADNVIADVDTALSADVDRSDRQSTGLAFHNNTVVGTRDAAVVVSGVDGLENYNNIFASAASDLLVTEAPRDATRANAVAYMDDNLIWSEAGPYWTLSLGGEGAQRFVGLDAWRAAWSGVNHDDLAADPDRSSLFADPQFVNAPGGDYRTQNPALVGAGRDGANIGARQ